MCLCTNLFWSECFSDVFLGSSPIQIEEYLIYHVEHRGCSSMAFYICHILIDTSNWRFIRCNNNRKLKYWFSDVKSAEKCFPLTKFHNDYTVTLLHRYNVGERTGWKTFLYHRCPVGVTIECKYRGCTSAHLPADEPAMMHSRTCRQGRP